MSACDVVQRPGHLSSDPAAESGRLPKHMGGDIKWFEDYTEPHADSSQILPPNEFEPNFRKNLAVFLELLDSWFVGKGAGT